MNKNFATLGRVNKKKDNFFLNNRNSSFYKVNLSSGISLITMIITIIVIIILTSITIIMSMNTIEQAQEAKFKNALSCYKEELEMFVMEKRGDVDKQFIRESLMARETMLSYNTMEEIETGNIRTVLPSIDNNMNKKIEILKGELFINTKTEAEIKWANEMGVRINPYDITNEGELLSSNANLALVDSEGTLRLPNYITAIAPGAFTNIENLKTIIIPGSVKKIGDDAFRWNKTLETVIMEEGVESIGIKAFMGCGNLKNVQMPNSVKNIGIQAFYYCTSLNPINLPSELKQIQNWAFTGCSKFKKIDIPSGVQKIGAYAFSNCENLESISIPESVYSIDSTSFNGCKNLTNIDVKNPNFRFNNGMLLNISSGTIIFVLDSLVEGNKIVVPEGITQLALGQFKMIEENVEIIEIPKSVTSISPEFISKPLSNIIISPENPNFTSDDKCIYSKDKKKLIKYYSDDTIITVPEGVESIEYNAFGRSNITNITLPNSLKRLESFSLGYCSNLTNISLGKNINFISPLFIYGSKVTNVIIDNDNAVYVIENNILMNKEKTQLILPIVPTGKMTSFEIPYGITEISDYAFHNQYNLKEIFIPETVVKIGNSFNYCGNMEKIQIPSSVKKIQKSCFSECTLLKEIIINQEKGSIPDSPWGCIYGERAIKWRGQ